MRDMILVGLVVFVFIALPMIGLFHSERQKHECRIEALKAGKNGDEIQQICGK